MDEENENSLRGISKEIAGIFFASTQKQSVEREMLKLSLYTFIGLLVLGTIGYFGFFSQIPNFLQKFGMLFFYLITGLVAITATIWHLKSYKNVSCPTGMMVGMTVGMLSGFLIGLIVGITNGMLVGTITGMFIGIFLGSWTGKCCGIMGVLEGQMAGFMAGPMGAMTSIMMANDNYMLYIPIALAFTIIVLAGLIYLLYKENAGEELNVAKKTAKEDFVIFLALNLAILAIIAWIIIYGPKSELFRITIN